jgi:hypothetical protein
MKTATTASRTTSREAKHWIERQLRWERTLGALRNQQVQRRAA